MILITTPVANFELHKVSNVNMSMANQLAMAQRYALRQPDWFIAVCNTQGEQVAEYGPEDIVPRVWSHTPFTFGMDPEAIQTKFEERACSVLADYEYDHPMRKMPDGRYHDFGLRAAWMMYVDLSIEHYNTAV